VAETPHLEIVQIVAGPIETNLFLVIEKASKKTMLIDGPPDSLDPAMAEIDRRGLEPEMIVITHGHWDHIGDADALRLLLELGAAANATTSDGTPALTDAAVTGQVECVEALLTHGARPRQRDGDGATALIAAVRPVNPAVESLLAGDTRTEAGPARTGSRAHPAGRELPRSGDAAPAARGADRRHPV